MCEPLLLTECENMIEPRQPVNSKRAWRHSLRFVWERFRKNHCEIPEVRKGERRSDSNDREKRLQYELTSWSVCPICQQCDRGVETSGTLCLSR